MKNMQISKALCSLNQNNYQAFHVERVSSEWCF